MTPASNLPGSRHLQGAARGQAGGDNVTEAGNRGGQAISTNVGVTGSNRHLDKIDPSVGRRGGELSADGFSDPDTIRRLQRPGW